MVLFSFLFLNKLNWLDIFSVVFYLSVPGGHIRQPVV